MNKDLKKPFRVIIYIIAVYIFVSFILYFVNNYSIVKNKDLLRTSLNNEKNKSSENAITEPIRVNEDSDVYGQRQMRADYNSGSSSSGY